MKTLDIVKNEKALRKGAKPNDSDSYNRAVGNVLKEQVIKHNGYGLSSPQVGIFDAKVCVINVREPIVLINPRIVESSGSAEFTEGCLSFPGQTVRTQRHTEIVVEADNFQGRLWFSASDPDDPDESDPDFIECVATQHELDHINGILMFDREVKGETYVKSGLDTLGRNDKVKVKTQGGDVFKIKWKKAKKKVEASDWKVLETCDE